VNLSPVKLMVGGLVIEILFLALFSPQILDRQNLLIDPFLELGILHSFGHSLTGVKRCHASAA
jgi:hypothetical protein